MILEKYFFRTTTIFCCKAKNYVELHLLNNRYVIKISKYILVPEDLNLPGKVVVKTYKKQKLIKEEISFLAETVITISEQTKRTITLNKISQKVKNVY